MPEYAIVAAVCVSIPVCVVAILAISALIRSNQAVVETNAMLSYTTRYLADVVATPREEQVDRMRELHSAMDAPVDPKPRSVGAEKGGYLPGFLERDYDDDPAGSGV